MDVHEYVAALRKHWVVIVALAVLGGLVGLLYSYSLTPTYKATSSVFVSNPQGATTDELVQGSTFTQNLVASYAQLATMPIVLDPVISALGLNESAPALSKSITANNPLNTVIIQISATDANPRRAAAIANDTAASLGQVASKLAPKGANGASTITMAVTSPAQVPQAPIAPRKELITISGLIVGLILGILYALLRELLDTRVRYEKDVQRAADTVVLGSIVRRRRGETGIAMLTNAHGAVAEGFRRVRTNLEFAEIDRHVRVLAVSSALPGEGKSTFVVNIAFAMAELGQRVLIIDADLRKPSIADYTGVEGAVGLTTVLAGKIEVSDAIQTVTDNVDVLSSGAIPPNPSQLLGSTTMHQLMDDVATLYDFVVVDTPPILPAADALALSHLTDGTIIIALYNTTKRAQLARAINGLNAVNSRILGVVINQTKPTGYEYYAYGAAKAIPGARKANADTPKPNAGTAKANADVA